MKKILLFTVLLALFAGCASSPTQNAVKLIKAGADAYIEKPTYVFNEEVEPIIDKASNSVIGYYLTYEITTGGEKFVHKAKFDKDIAIITDDRIVVNGVDPYELMERVNEIINRDR